MNILLIVYASLAAGAASWLATGAVLRLLRRRGVLDIPNERSSHSSPTPRGGGIAVAGVLFAAWLGFWLSGTGGLAAPHFWIILAAGAALAVISWFDDVRGGLPPTVRLGAQAIAVGAGLMALPEGAGVFQGALPPALDLALSGLIWLWFVNLFNFMDGIDGISGVEAASIGGGIALIAVYKPDASIDPLLAATVSAAAVGFLCWNWHPAKIFLGDVGSVPLGFLLGWLLLNLASGGAWAAAAILPLYYLADATITLARRALRGEMIWQAHREHFYQRAVRNGRSHAAVSLGVALCNVILVGLAMLSMTWPWAALTAAAAAVFALLVWLSR